MPPATTFSLIQELIHRDGLRSALSSRDDVLLEPILQMLLKHVIDPRFGEMVCDVAGVVIGKLTRRLVSPADDSKLMTSCDRYVHSRFGSITTNRFALP